jgi:hypothetical protein
MIEQDLKGKSGKATQDSIVPESYLPSSLAKDFSNDDLVDQFILTRSQAWIPESWNKKKLHSWHLGTHPSLPVVQFTFANSNITCTLLGFIASASGEILENGQTLSLSFSEKNFVDEFENWLYAHCGRYVAILTGSIYERVYLDPFGSLATVFSAKAETVSSTNMLIPYNEGLNDNLALINKFEIPLKSNYFSLGLDPRHNVERLLPNHFLSLADWSSSRHWPTEDFTVCNNPLEIVAEIGTMLGDTIKSFAEHYGRVQLPITAGGDSRMVLAGARETRDKIDLFTFDLEPSVDPADLRVGSSVASQAKLPHAIYTGHPPGEIELRRWLWRNGATVTAPVGWKNQHAFRSMNPDYPSFPAVAGELGRPIVYRDMEEIINPLNVPALLQRWHIPVIPETVAAAQSWQTDLNTSDAMTMMGLFYLENRVGCWASPVLYSQCLTGCCCVYPYNNRRIISLLLSLPKNYRLRENFVIDLIRQKWPALLYPAFSNESRKAWLAKLLFSGLGRIWCPLKAKGS